MPVIWGMGSSLLAVGAFGLTTAITYGMSGLIDWPVAAEYLAGGLAGGLLGMALASGLAPRKAALNRIFASLVFVVAAYMRSEEHTSELQSPDHLVCRLLLE